ncbi:MAG: maleate cis-trans isomerase [Hyphomicrobiales bacterium]|nr:maleate cis-trans isomerase [Hyphomicrobiales bacterium]
MHRLGFLIPQRNVACEIEFPRFAPEGVSCHFQRLPRDGATLTRESLVAMMETVGEQSRALAGIDIRVIMCACTSGSFLDGTESAWTLGANVTAATGIPGITTTVAVVDALRSLEARRIFMVTPYPEDITRREAEVFGAMDFEITSWRTFGCAQSEMIRQLTSADVERLVLSEHSAAKAADAVFVSCTNLMTMDRILSLERKLGIPVISSNSATLWRALREAGVPATDLGAGCLFEHPLLEGSAISREQAPAGREIID